MGGRRNSDRLPTFKGKRDLNLSASTANSLGKRGLLPAAAAVGAGGAARGASDTKKKFVPNLNVTRKARTEGSTENDYGRTSRQQKSNWRKTEDPAAGRGRGGGGGKPRQELIQTMNVFSEGIGSSEGIRRKGSWGSGGGSGGGDTKSSIERPKLNLDFKIDKEAEAARLKDLLRDDFIDDLSSGPLVPVQLPMVDTGTLFKNEEEEDEEAATKGVKKKKKRGGAMAIDSDDEDSNKDTLAKSDESKVPSSSKSAVMGIKNANKRDQLKFQDLVKAQKGDLFFLQLPDHLPGAATAKQPPPEAAKDPHQASTSATEELPIESRLKEKCTLRDLPEGYLGKIQIRKSGRAQMVVGDTYMDMELGTQVGFLQDLASINVPPADAAESEQQQQQQSSADLTVIGRVRHRIVLTPDWSKLFGAHVSSSSGDEDEAG